MDWVESDVAAAVAEYFSSLGYEVKAEIRGCDVVAIKHIDSAPRLTVIETKLRFNLKLLYQAITRFDIADEVLVAFLRPHNMGRKSHWRDLKNLAKHSGIGILLVSGDKQAPLVQVALEAGGSRRKRIKTKRLAIEREFHNRLVKGQIGGVNKVKILTAYRELAISLAVYLTKKGPCKTCDLIKQGFPKQVSRMLWDNHYGWYERLGRGLYKVQNHTESAITKDFLNCWQVYTKKWDSHLK